MTDYLFPRQICVDDHGNMITNTVGYVYDQSDKTYTNPVQVFDLDGTPMTVVTVGRLPMTPEFVADRSPLVWKSGNTPPVTIWSPGPFADAAQAAQTAAEAAQQAAEDAAATAAAPAESAVESVISTQAPDSSSTLRQSLDAVYAPQSAVDAVAADAAVALKRYGPKWTDSNLSGVSSHGTGGNINPYMVGLSESAARACIQEGDGALDFDLSYDGSIRPDGTRAEWCVHDWTQTTLGVKASGYPSSVIADARWDHTKITGGSYPDEPILTLGELLDKFGGIVPINIEPKDQSQQDWWHTSCISVAAEINKRGLQDYVAISCSATNLDWKISEIKSAGIKCWRVYLTGSQTNDDSLVNLIGQSGGCVGVSLSSTVDDSHLAQWKAIVPNVSGFGGTRRSDATSVAYWQGRGINLYSSQRPGYWAGLTKTQTRTFWDVGRWSQGDIPEDVLPTRQTLQADGLLLDQFNAGAYSVMTVGDLGPLPAAFTLEMMATYVQAPTSGTATVGVVFCADTDASYSGYDAVNAYLASINSAGSLRISTRDPSSAIQSSATGTTPTVGQDCGLRVVVTASAVSVQQLDATGAPIGTPVTYADTRWRNGYVHVYGVNETALFKIRTVTVTAN